MSRWRASRPRSASPDLVRAFLDAGAHTYVAPEAPPFSHSGAMFVALLFYGLTQDMDITEAVERAGRVHPELSMWKVFTA